MKNVHFTTSLNARHARSDERVATSSRRICIFYQPVLSVRHARSDEKGRSAARRASKFEIYHILRKGRSASLKICSLPQFWASDTHDQVTSGSLGEPQNLNFTTVLSVRHARSDVRVAPICEKFAFYHSFERLTRTKWRESCQIHRCDPCAPTEKEYILRLFQRILISSLSLQSFL